MVCRFHLHVDGPLRINLAIDDRPGRHPQKSQRRVGRRLLNLAEEVVGFSLQGQDGLQVIQTLLQFDRFGLDLREGPLALNGRGDLLGQVHELTFFRIDVGLDRGQGRVPEQGQAAAGERDDDQCLVVPGQPLKITELNSHRVSYPPTPSDGSSPESSSSSASVPSSGRGGGTNSQLIAKVNRPCEFCAFTRLMFRK